jgi:hypothetical protein
VEHAAEINLQIFFGNRVGTLEIEPPLLAVGQDAPAQLPARYIVDAAEIIEDLV